MTNDNFYKVQRKDFERLLGNLSDSLLAGAAICPGPTVCQVPNPKVLLCRDQTQSVSVCACAPCAPSFLTPEDD